MVSTNIIRSPVVQYRLSSTFVLYNDAATMKAPHLDLTVDERQTLWTEVIRLVERHYSNPQEQRVAPLLDQDQVAHYVRGLSFDDPAVTTDVLSHVVDGLKRHIVHTSHPHYYGLFNPRPNFPSILADLLTAAFNPQMAAWSHAPYAVEAEQYTIEEVGAKFGWSRDGIDGTYCTGGAEANLTAVLCALQHAYPDYAEQGVIGLSERPVIYTSAQSHHSVARAARVAGLGAMSVREVAVDPELKMSMTSLRKQVEEDIAAGLQPIMIAATAGATGPGAIDPLVAISDYCKSLGIWCHVDGAYGGAMILSDRYRHHLNGVEHADSITFDVHKWTSVPMGASLFLTRHVEILSETFRINAAYMPKDTATLPITDPFTHSIQWSRRFIGLKMYMTLATFGWRGMNDLVNSTIEIGDYTRERLSEYGWQMKNSSVMPIVCFNDNRLKLEAIQQICDTVNKTGEVWISTYPIFGELTLRICITNYNTTIQHIDQLVDLLNITRKRFL